MECEICANNVLVKKIVSCPSCEYKACKDCIKKYFETLQEPACPSCSVVWTREFISSHFKSFYTDYKKMREKVLLEREKVLMPETQELAEREKQARKLEAENTVRAERLRLLSMEMSRLKDKIFISGDAIYQLRRLPTKTGKVAGPSGPRTLYSCPVDKCRGFITSEHYKCGLCNTSVCKNCEKILAAEVVGEVVEQHVCSEADVQTVKTVRKETKPCPKCYTSIYKIDGCDQMWCTQCKTPFSWKTGEEVHERVHNPHFYEWQRQNGGGVAPRVEEFDVCGNVTIQTLSTAIRGRSMFYNLHMFSGHLMATIPDPPQVNNVDLRISYLLEDTTEEIFARKVQQRDKKREKENEIRQIVEIFCREVNEIFRAIVAKSRLNQPSAKLEKVDLVSFVDDVNRLITFVNEQLGFVSKKYVSKAKKIVRKPDTPHDDIFEFV